MQSQVLSLFEEEHGARSSSRCVICCIQPTHTHHTPHTAAWLLPQYEVCTHLSVCSSLHCSTPVWTRRGIKQEKGEDSGTHVPYHLLCVPSFCMCFFFPSMGWQGAIIDKKHRGGTAIPSYYTVTGFREEGCLCICARREPFIYSFMNNHTLFTYILDLFAVYAEFYFFLPKNHPKWPSFQSLLVVYLHKKCTYMHICTNVHIHLHIKWSKCF